MSPDKIARMEQAKRILGDELFQEALNAIRADLTEQMITCPIRDDEGRRIIAIMIHCMAKVPQFLQSVVDEGKLHQHEIQELKRFSIQRGYA